MRLLGKLWRSEVKLRNSKSDKGLVSGRRLEVVGSARLVRAITVNLDPASPSFPRQRLLTKRRVEFTGMNPKFTGSTIQG